MSKKNKDPEIQGLKIFLIIGAVGAAAAALILGFLAFVPMNQPKIKVKQDPDPGSQDNTSDNG